MADQFPKSIPRKEFWHAVRTSDVAMLDRICAGIDLPTFTDTQNSDHIFINAMGNATEISVLQWMSEHGVDPTAVPNKGTTFPLTNAIRARRIDYVDFLLSHGACPNADLDRFRVTLAAVSSDFETSFQIDVLKKLIDHRADLNFLFPLFGDERNAFTVLDHATHDEVKAFLRSHGALTAKEIRGATLSAKSPANTLSSKMDEVVSHMEGLFGKADAKSFTDILKVDSGISVHVVRPQSNNGFFTLFTTGLSRKRMNVSSNAACDGFAELYLQLPGNWNLFGTDTKFRWPAQLLSDLASYPVANNAVFQAPLTIITNGDPPEPLHPSVPFTANCLFADKDFERSDGKVVNLFCVMPLYQSEADLALRSIPEFLNALDRAAVNRVLDPSRKLIVG